MKTIHHNVVVVGGGPAGMAAAVASYDAGERDVVIIDREQELGGILMQCIHSGFGIHKLGKELTGPEYAEEYKKRVTERGIKTYFETMVTSISRDKTVTVQNREGITKIKAKAVILAMGCRERSRGAINICGSRPAGIYSAGAAQKLINCEGYQVGKRAVILGSGDIGLIMARRLTLQGVKVEAVCEIMSYSGGLARNIVQCLEDFDIPLYLSTTVVEVHGKNRVEGVTVAKVDENKKIIKDSKRYIPCDTLLLSVGLIPENELTRSAGISIDGITGGAMVDQSRQTDMNGVFACGNVLQVHDLVDFVSDEAEIAGKSAALYCADKLNESEENRKEITVTADHGVRYVVPQKITDASGDVSFYMRVTQPFDKVRMVIKADGKTVYSSNIKTVSPGEMEKITVKSDVLKNTYKNISVSVENVV